MGVITIRCPRTGMQVSTGLETDEASFEAMPAVGSTMRCPAVALSTSGPLIEGPATPVPRLSDDAVPLR